MRALIRAFKKANNTENNAVYVFLVNLPCSDASLMGFMPFSKQYGFVFVPTTGTDATTLSRTIAHEVAHGTFNLRHTFSPENKYTLPQGTTDNLMDYPSTNSGQATALAKYQWDLIHNPESVWFSWLKEEEEGMAIVSLSKKLNSEQINKLNSSIQRLLNKSFIFSHIYKIYIDNTNAKEEYEFSIYDGFKLETGGEIIILPCSYNLSCKGDAKYKVNILIRPEIFNDEKNIDATLYEEIFHCGQAIYYGIVMNNSGWYNINQNWLIYETEVKIAKAFSGITSEGIENYLVNWAKDEIVKKYFEKIRNQTVIDTLLEKQFRDKVADLAMKIFYLYKIRRNNYEKEKFLYKENIENSNEFIDFKSKLFSTPYFEALSKMYVK